MMDSSSTAHEFRRPDLTWD